MYRHDARRTGATGQTVPAEVETQWEVEVGGSLAPPVVAGGRVYVAAKDQHAIYALDVNDGGRLWRYTADAGIDSPPTVHEGRVLFGCTDGWVYCLRASDGELAWRFRAAPAERLIVHESQLESAWPVHGSVVIQDGVVYCSAGRSSFLDGGLYLYGLNPETGEVVHEGRLDTLSATRTDAVDEPFVPAFHIEGSRSDLLVAEGGYLYINQTKFSPELQVQETPYVPHSADETGAGLDVAEAPYVAENPYLKKGFDEAAALGVNRGHMGDHQVGLHLFSTGGFLEDSWYNRTYWMYAKTWPGFQMAHIAPKAGQLLVIGDEMTYAVHAYPTRNVHSPMFIPGEQGYLLIADSNDNEPMLDYRSWGRDKGMGFTRASAPKWHQWVPIRMRSMVLAGERLFVAGPPDVVEEGDPMAAFEGRKGAKLRVVSAADGGRLAEHELDSPPVFDGMIAANGRLYISSEKGSVLCLGDR
jgi:outer membrane protein assembly factor BamB